MNPIIVMLIVIIALFVGAFLSKRRFGLLGLGLAAGAVLSPIWSVNASYVIAVTGLVREGAVLNVIAIAAITLIPAVLFMFHGYSYKSMVGRVIGSLLFAALAVGFLITPLASILTITGPVGLVYHWFEANRDLIISFGLIIAVTDTLTARSSHKKSENRHH
jgi:hypothetical protein